MSVKIEMELPANCWDCRFSVVLMGHPRCMADGPLGRKFDSIDEYEEKRAEWCPLKDEAPGARWISRKTPTGRKYSECSNCGACIARLTESGGVEKLLMTSRFCPNCGARMEKEETEE